MGTYTHSEPNKQFYKNRRSSKMSSTMDKTKAKAKEVAIEDFNKAKALAQSAAKSGAYLYPIKGIFYFLSPLSLEAPPIQARPNLVPLCCCGCGHVLGRISAATCRARIRQRSSGRFHHDSAHPQRIVHPDQSPLADILATRCPGGYI